MKTVKTKDKQTKFTPGPWESLEWEPYMIFTAHKDDPNRGTHIADVSGFDDGETDEVVANAHLIAAAPDLYEELRCAASTLCDIQCTEPKHTAACERSWATLAKARGDR